jgi:hypothetical protein
MGKKAIRDLDWIVRKWLPYFTRFQITEEVLRAYHVQYKELQPAASDLDFLWNVFQVLGGEIANQAHTEEQLYQLNVELNMKMWEFLIVVERRNGNHVKKVMHENQLRLWQLTARFKTEVKIIAGHCCPFCDDLDSKIISFEKALATQPLASEQCTRERGCNCCYTQVAVRNADGRPILH